MSGKRVYYLNFINVCLSALGANSISAGGTLAQPGIVIVFPNRI